MDVSDNVVSLDGVLKVALLAFQPETGEGIIQIEELRQDHAQFYVTVMYGQGGQIRNDYKTYDVNKQSKVQFFANRNDLVSRIEIVRVPGN
jgi:hypothetical protein